MWRSGNSLNILLLMALVTCALSAVSSQHKARRLYIELQQEKENAQQMEVEWGQLQLELSTWAMPARVERIAIQKLKMHLPERDQVRFIELVPAASGLPHPSSDVADAPFDRANGPGTRP